MSDVRRCKVLMLIMSGWNVVGGVVVASGSTTHTHPELKIVVHVRLSVALPYSLIQTLMDQSSP